MATYTDEVIYYMRSGRFQFLLNKNGNRLKVYNTAGLLIGEYAAFGMPANMKIAVLQSNNTFRKVFVQGIIRTVGITEPDSATAGTLPFGEKVAKLQEVVEEGNTKAMVTYTVYANIQ